MKALRNKKILITAGPTWVPIDTVRVISNSATGETGMLLAREARKQGGRVTVLLGPVTGCNQVGKTINLIRFRYFDELSMKLKSELKKRVYDAVIHSAAVSDYKPGTTTHKKIGSGINKLSIPLVPTNKLIDSIKNYDPKTLLVGFKFDPRAEKKKLLELAKILMKRSGADLIVANSAPKKRYLAYIVEKEKIRGPFFSKAKMAKELIHKTGELLCLKPN